MTAVELLDQKEFNQNCRLQEGLFVVHKKGERIYFLGERVKPDGLQIWATNIESNETVSIDCTSVKPYFLQKGDRIRLSRSETMRTFQGRVSNILLRPRDGGLLIQLKEFNKGIYFKINDYKVEFI